MAWVKIDDQFADHPKIKQVGPVGLAIHVTALCYSNRFLTDGFISESSAKSITLGMLLKENDWPQKMVAAGLWDKTDGGYLIHDFLEYNPSKEHVLAKREQAKEAAKIGAKSTNRKRWGEESLSPDVSAERSAVRRPTSDTSAESACIAPVPVPVPNPVPKPENLPPTGTPLPPKASPEPERSERTVGSVPVSENGAAKTVGSVLRDIVTLSEDIEIPSPEEYNRQKNDAMKAKLAEYKAERAKENQHFEAKKREAVQHYTDAFAELIPGADDTIRADLFDKISRLPTVETLQTVLEDVKIAIESGNSTNPKGLIFYRLKNI